MAEKEYIERERYCDMNKFAQSICEDMTLTEEEANKFISLLWQHPTADVAEVKHAEWVLEHGTYGRMICSLCKEEALANDFNESVDSDFCPHCGAKMDGKGN